MTTVAGPAAEGSELDSLAAQGGAPPRRKGRGGRVNKGEGRLAFYLITPTIAILGLVVGYPIVKAIIQSFQSDPGLNPTTGFFDQGGAFVGLANYKHWILQQCGNVACPPGALGAQFYDALYVTVLFTVISVGVESVIGMIFALMMNRAFRGRGIVRASILVPWAIPTAVTAKLWYVMLQPDGIINKIFGTHFVWTGSKWPARFGVMFADIWKTTPFIALLILAGLQTIPADIYESAKVDGANAWQRFWRITLPLAKPAVAVAVIFRVLDVLRIYDLPAILTGGANGTTTLSILVVDQLREGTYSASALSTITFLFIFLCAFALVRIFGANIVQSQAKGVKK